MANAVASEVCLLFLDFLRGSRSEDDAVRGVQPFHILLTGLLGLDFGSGVKVFFCQFYTAFIFFPLASVGKQNTKDAKGQCGYDVFQLDELAYDETCCTKPSNHKE